MQWCLLLRDLVFHADLSRERQECRGRGCTATEVFVEIRHLVNNLGNFISVIGVSNPKYLEELKCKNKKEKNIDSILQKVHMLHISCSGMWMWLLHSPKETKEGSSRIVPWSPNSWCSRSEPPWKEESPGDQAGQEET